MAKYLGIEASDKQPYIFVSYNSEDEQRVGKIVGELCHYNINIWYDYGLTVGEKWEKEIADHIQNSSMVVFFISQKIFDKEESYVEKEYRVTKRHFNKPTCVVMLDEITEENVSNSYKFWWEDMRKEQTIKCNGLTERLIAQKIGDVVNFRFSNISVSQEINVGKENLDDVIFYNDDYFAIEIIEKDNLNEKDFAANKLYEVALVAIHKFDCRDYKILNNRVYLTKTGKSKIEKFFNIENLLEFDDIYKAVLAILSAQYVLKKNRDYCIKSTRRDNTLGSEDKVYVLSQEKESGKLYFSNGVHQAIEQKEGIKIDNYAVLRNVVRRKIWHLESEMLDSYDVRDMPGDYVFEENEKVVLGFAWRTLIGGRKFNHIIITNQRILASRGSFGKNYKVEIPLKIKNITYEVLNESKYVGVFGVNAVCLDGSCFYMTMLTEDDISRSGEEFINVIMFIQKLVDRYKL